MKGKKYWLVLQMENTHHVLKDESLFFVIEKNNTHILYQKGMNRMINKQNLWFLTLFSLILVLSVYYITMPNELLLTQANEEKEEAEEQEDVEVVTYTNSLVALRVSLEEERRNEMVSLQTTMTDENTTTEEKNEAFEQLRYLNQAQGKEEALEKKIKEEFDLDSFIHIDNKDISVTAIAKEHDKALANNIMRLIQKEYKKKMYITVKFQNS